MKKSNKTKMKFIVVLLAITILVSLIATLVVTNAEVIKNPNPDQGTVSPPPTYMSESNSAYSSAYAKYGSNLIRKEYAWNDPHGNTPERTGFNPGPAPDRPDVLFNTYNASVPKVILGSQMLTSEGPNGVNSPYVASFSGAPIAMAGQLFASGSVRVNISNSTTRNALVSLDPHTGAVNWASLLGLGPTAGTSIGSALSGTSYIFRVDDTHLCTVGLMSGGLAMWRTDGTFLWQDNSIQAGAFYHALVVAPDPVYKVFMVRSPGLANVYTNYLMGWTLDNPDQDRSLYGSTGAFLTSGRNIWNYTVDEAGNTPIQCYGDGRVYMASYSSTKVYAINATNGEKIWETEMNSFNGYMTCFGEGKLFVGCLSYTVTALNAATGAIIWRNNDAEANRGYNSWCMNFAYKRVYMHDLGSGRTGAMKCLDADTGKTLWAATELNSIGYYVTVVADGKVFGNQADGSTSTGRIPDPVNFACWDAFTGKVIWNIRENIVNPIVAYGCLYFILNGQIYALSTAVKPGQNWDMWRGNAEKPGWTLSPGPADLRDGPKWTYTTGSGIISSPVVANGRLYINSNDGYTYCLNAYTGSRIWRHASNEPLMTSMGSTPAIVGNKVIVGPDDGNLYILNAETGNEISKVFMGPYRSVQIALGQHNIRSSPIIYGGKIYVGSIHSDKFYCVNLNGQVEWAIETGRVAGSAGIGNGAIYVQSMTNRLYKITPSGSVVWNVSCISASTSSSSYTPVIADNIVYVGVINRNLTAYSAIDGNLVINTRQPNTGSDSTHGGVTYAPDWAFTALNSSGYQFGRSNSANANITAKIISQSGSTIACMRADNGSNIWSTFGSWAIWSSPIVAGIGNTASVYICSEIGSIQVINASTGTPISWYTTGANIGGSPAIWDGKLYIGSSDNKVYCFEDHSTQNMDIALSLDKTTVNTQDSESVTVTVKLTAVPSVNPYEEIGLPAPIPTIPSTKVLVTFTNPSGIEFSIPATTDAKGVGIVSYIPKLPGTWKVIASYNGQDKPTISYNYAFSEQINIEATQPPATTTPTPVPTEVPATTTPTPVPTEVPATTTPTPVPTEVPATTTPTPVPTASPTATPTPTDNTITYALVAVAIVVIVVIAAAYMLLKRKAHAHE